MRSPGDRIGWAVAKPASIHAAAATHLPQTFDMPFPSLDQRRIL
jgi:hypothetical protein